MLAMQPTLFLGHGGGPLPLLGHDGHADLLATWAPGGPLHGTLHAESVRALVVVSAHHESGDGVVEVMTDARPGLLFDYGGFPPETYRYTIDNPGEPQLAQRVISILDSAGIATRAQRGRGHDHGVFVPLMGLRVTAERPNLPVVSVSLRGPGSHRPGVTDEHVALGRALAPLRGEGVLLVGSGNSHHGQSTVAEGVAFDEHLRSLAAEGPEALSRWADHPAARACHPRPEHLLPLLVCAGASEGSKVVAIPHDFMGNAASHFLFH
jgi:aromatic ring-opening dioxygenase catalytic subunit (LigB family)